MAHYAPHQQWSLVDMSSPERCHCDGQARLGWGLRLAAGLVIVSAWFVLGFLPPSPSAAALAQSTTRLMLPIVAANHDLAWRWSATAPVDLTPTPYHGPFPAVDNTGRLHLFWDTLYSPRHIYHTYLSEVGWSPLSPVAESLGASTLLGPPLVDASGHLHLTWRNHLGYGVDNPYRLLYGRFDGTTWSPDEELARGTAPGVKGVAHPDLAGQIRVTMYDAVFPSAAYQFVRSQDPWQRTGPIRPGHAVNAVVPDLQGGIRFFSGLGDLFYSHWRDGQFVAAGTKLAGSVLSRQVMADAYGSVHVFGGDTVPIPGGSVYGLYHRCLQPEAAWTVEQVLSGENALVGQAVGAAGLSKTFALLWVQTPHTSQAMLALWRGCDLTGSTAIAVPTGYRLAGITLNDASGKACVVARHANTPTVVGICSELPVVQ
jgi:hypothetical protein